MASTPATSHPVTFQAVTLVVEPWKHPSGRDYWRARYKDHNGRDCSITRNTLAKAKEVAMNTAIELAKGVVDFKKLSPHQIRGIKRMLEADPQLSLVDDFLLYHKKRLPKKNLGEALDEFLAVKKANKGLSGQNVKTLGSRLSVLEPLRGRILSDVQPADLALRPELAARTRLNIRGSLVTFFRWCVKQGYLPKDEDTAPERMEKPITRRKIPATYDHEQLKALLENVKPRFLPWLACGAFAGIRTDEIYPLATSDKSPVDWKDFKWERNLIEIRPETDKNGQRRWVPILPALRSWLYPVRQKSGPLISSLPSSGNEPETTRLGSLIGGWKPNALRHSFISNRAALKGLAQAALEAGNSESESAFSYNDAKTKAEARKWFGVFRVEQ